jgi:WD40 repeat protein
MITLIQTGWMFAGMRMIERTTPAALTPQNAAEVVEWARLDADYDGPIQMLAFSPDSARLACATQRQVYGWDHQRRRLLFKRELLAQSLVFSPDGTQLVVAGQDITFLDAASGEQQAVLKGHADGTTAAAFSPDGTLLASGGMDGLVRIGHLETRRLVGRLTHESPVRAIAFSPDGVLLATISWGGEPRRVTLWDVATGTARTRFACDREKHLAFSPDGARLAVDGKIFELADERVIYDLNERQAVFSPDGRMIAACHANYPTVSLWNAASGAKLGTLKGHAEPVWQVAFSPDGALLASASGSLGTGALLRGDTDSLVHDRSVRLWAAPAVQAAAQDEAPRPRKPLKRLGEDPEEKEDTLLKPVQDWLKGLNR